MPPTCIMPHFYLTLPHGHLSALHHAAFHLTLLHGHLSTLHHAAFHLTLLHGHLSALHHAAFHLTLLHGHLPALHHAAFHLTLLHGLPMGGGVVSASAGSDVSASNAVVPIRLVIFIFFSVFDACGTGMPLKPVNRIRTMGLTYLS